MCVRWTKHRACNAHKIQTGVMCVYIHRHSSYQQQGKTRSMNFKYLYNSREPRSWPGSVPTAPVGHGLCSFKFKHMGLSRHFQLLWVFTVRETTQLRINIEWSNTGILQSLLKEKPVSFWFWGMSPPTLWIRGVFLGKAKQIYMLSQFFSHSSDKVH